jgi:HEAT repeat protein
MVLVKIGELHSDDSDVREDAAKWLGDSHDPRAVRPLIEAMQHDRKDDVREEAARALGQIGGMDAERALTITSTNDPDDDVRRSASKALARMVKQTTKRVSR